MAEQDWYKIADIETLDSPALVVYPGRVKHNIGLLISMIDNKSRLRPHVKTFKNREVTQMMLEAGITKFKCATIAEAEMLAICGAPDVLLAYQPVGPKLVRFISLIKTYPETYFSCLTDNMPAAKEIAKAAERANITISVFIDLNIGQNRTGITPDDGALQLYIDCCQLPGTKPVGLHAYDGHLHSADIAERAKACNKGFEPVLRLRGALKQQGYGQAIIVAGGSPTFPVHAERKGIECSPGTFVYWDKGYQTLLPEQDFLQAVLVVGRVISLPAKNRICIDTGHKSVSAENDLSKRIFFLNAPGLRMVNQSEEHLVAETDGARDYNIGDVLYGMPYHVCPTVALYERAVTIEKNSISGAWKNIARDRKINI